MKDLKAEWRRLQEEHPAIEPFPSALFQSVHCLLCDHVYPEKVPMVKECANCGNQDTKQTHYLEDES